MQSIEFERPDEVLQPNFGDHGGETVLVIVGGHHDNYATKFGTKAATRYTVVLLTGKHAGKVAMDGLAFGGVQSQLASKSAGAVIVARVRKEDRSITLDNPGGYDMDLATRWTQAFPGQLDVLRRDAVETYYTRSKELAEGNQGQAGAPPTLQHFPVPGQAPSNGGSYAPAQATQVPAQQQPSQPSQPQPGYTESYPTQPPAPAPAQPPPPAPAQPQPGWTQEAREAMPPLPTTNPFIGTGVPVVPQDEQPPF